MDNGTNKPQNLIDTTDCLEAIGVFRCWKNLFFTITFISLLLLQGAFWYVNLGYLDTEQDKDETSTVILEKTVYIIIISKVGLLVNVYYF